MALGLRGPGRSDISLLPLYSLSPDVCRDSFSRSLEMLGFAFISMSSIRIGPLCMCVFRWANLDFEAVLRSSEAPIRVTRTASAFCTSFVHVPHTLAFLPQGRARTEWMLAPGFRAFLSCLSRWLRSLPTIALTPCALLPYGMDRSYFENRNRMLVTTFIRFYVSFLRLFNILF